MGCGTVTRRPILDFVVETITAFCRAFAGAFSRRRAGHSGCVHPVRVEFWLRDLAATARRGAARGATASLGGNAPVAAKCAARIIAGHTPLAVWIAHEARHLQSLIGRRPCAYRRAGGKTIWLLQAELEERLRRPVDLCLLQETRLRDKILREGEEWTTST